jgi:hypothetical protein
LGSAALFAGPTLANSLHDEGDFGGGYRIIGPGGPGDDYLRHHVFRPYDERRSTAMAMARRGATITTAHPSTPASINAVASAFRSGQNKTPAPRSLLVRATVR